jgi:hypothetical protein
MTGWLASNEVDSNQPWPDVICVWRSWGKLQNLSITVAGVQDETWGRTLPILCRTSGPRRYWHGDEILTSQVGSCGAVGWTGSDVGGFKYRQKLAHVAHWIQCVRTAAEIGYFLSAILNTHLFVDSEDVRLLLPVAYVLVCVAMAAVAEEKHDQDQGAEHHSAEQTHTSQWVLVLCSSRSCQTSLTGRWRPCHTRKTWTRRPDIVTAVFVGFTQSFHADCRIASQIKTSQFLSTFFPIHNVLSYHSTRLVGSDSVLK